MLQALATSGAELVDVAGDGDGIDVGELAALLASGLRPKLCYLAPTFQNPSGSVLAVPSSVTSWPTNPR